MIDETVVIQGHPLRFAIRTWQRSLQIFVRSCCGASRCHADALWSIPESPLLGRHDATPAAGCQHTAATLGGHLFRTEFTHGPHLFRTKQAPVFAQGLAPSVAHSCWTHVRKQAVPTAFGTFFEFASSSSKNVLPWAPNRQVWWAAAAGDSAGESCVQIGIRLNPLLRPWAGVPPCAAVGDTKWVWNRTQHDARHFNGRLSDMANPVRWSTRCTHPGHRRGPGEAVPRVCGAHHRTSAGLHREGGSRRWMPKPRVQPFAPW